MHVDEKQIFLTYEVGGEFLKEKGEYTNGKIIKAPVMEKAKVTVILKQPFIDKALERPRKPRYQSLERFLSTNIGKMYSKWNQLSENKKISLAVTKYVRDLGGGKFTFTVE